MKGHQALVWHDFVADTEPTVIKNNGPKPPVRAPAVMLDSNGAPFFKKLGHLRGVREREPPTIEKPKRLTPEQEKVMTDHGLDIGYVMPPTDTAAKLDLLTYQSSVCVAGREVDFMPVLLDIMAHANIETEPGLPDVDRMKVIGDAMEAKNSGFTTRWRNLNKKELWLRHEHELLMVCTAFLFCEITYCNHMSRTIM